MIAKLITENSIETQEDLIAKLADAGFNVTQATVSRDIRDMKISKLPTGRGTYKYTLPRHEEHSLSLKFNEALRSAVKKVESAMNIVVVHTLPGLAPAVASGIDGMGMVECLGCVAGDDTIMIVFVDELAASDFKEEFRRYTHL